MRKAMNEEIESGNVKMFGTSPAALNGFLVTEQDAKTIYAKTLKNIPYIKSKIMPMLSFEESGDVLKEMQQ